MRILIAVVFWVGVYGIVRECLAARRRGPAITRAEKLYLATVLPLIFAAQLVLDVLGIAFQVATGISALAMGLALNAWAIGRRLRRAEPK